MLKDYVDHAQQLLLYFVQSFSNLFGKEHVVYNVHSLIHLADDARQFGVLHKVSSFKYESYLGQLKKLVRRPQQPCTQIVRHVNEGHCQSTSDTSQKQTDHATSHAFAKPHAQGPVPISLSHCHQYKQNSGADCCISTSEADSLF